MQVKTIPQGREEMLTMGLNMAVVRREIGDGSGYVVTFS